MSFGIAGDKRYEDAAREEVAKWPGVGVAFIKPKRGHPACVLGFNGQTRKVPFAGTPSDAKGPLNHAQDIRKVLREMGAKREAAKKPAAKPKAKKSKTRKPVVAIAASEPVVREDRWTPQLQQIRARLIEAHEQLQVGDKITASLPPPLTWWERALWWAFRIKIERKPVRSTWTVTHVCTSDKTPNKA